MYFNQSEFDFQFFGSLINFWPILSTVISIQEFWLSKLFHYIWCCIKKIVLHIETPWSYYSDFVPFLCIFFSFHLLFVKSHTWYIYIFYFFTQTIRQSYILYILHIELVLKIKYLRRSIAFCCCFFLYENISRDFDTISWVQHRYIYSRKWIKNRWIIYDYTCVYLS